LIIQVKLVVRNPVYTDKIKFLIFG